MSRDLVARFRVQLDEIEQAAQSADVKQGDPDWFVSEVKATGGEHFTVRSRRDKRPIARVQRLDGDGELAAILDGSAVAGHIARHDPARVLAEVRAKRRVLELWERENAKRYEHAEGEARAWLMDEVVAALGLPYAARPGYNEEWRP